MPDYLKEVKFDKYCKTCKHDVPEGLVNKDAGTYYDGWSGIRTKEEYVPCCYCLEEGMREGTEIPVEWEAKE